MMQWLQLIHSSLVAKGEGLPGAGCLPECPRAMLVGSRRDLITPEAIEDVQSKLKSACCNAPFGDIVVDKLLIDNTKAGRGKEGEDPGYRQIRENIHRFAQSLILATPLSWVAFRQLLQKTSIDEPVLSYSKVCVVAQQCNISEQVVSSVLHFYHQLGAILHYATIPSLANSIIVKPQWLIKQLRLLLMPEWFGHRPQHLQRFWRLLEEKGILAEALYRNIWKDCGLEAGPQALADLLDHFDLAKQIESCSADVPYSGIKYFVPCMLKVRPKGEISKPAGPKPVREAATLHIIFNMDYVPPGFFVRLIACMTKHESFSPLLEGVIYRDSIKFRCNEIDCVAITESLHSIQISFYRKVLRKKHHIHFSKACTSLREELYDVCGKVLYWLPSIKVDFAFMCSCSSDMDVNYFVKIKPGVHKGTGLFCKHQEYFELGKEHKYWLPPQPHNDVSFLMQLIYHCDFFVLQAYIEDGRLTKSETENVSREVENRLGDLVMEMEMVYSFSEAVNCLNPSPDPSKSVITDFAEGNDGTRYRLAEFLTAAKFHNTSKE